MEPSQGRDGLQEAHVPIRDALAAYDRPTEVKYRVFLQGSYKNDTNLGGDSDVDVVVRPASRLRSRGADLSGKALQNNGSHRVALERWESFRDHALKAMRARFGNAVKSGRKTLKLPKGELPADADLVVTLSYREGIAFYLPGQKRWVVSFPEQHHSRGSKKEKATSKRFKRTVRMFKAARNRLVERKALTKGRRPFVFHRMPAQQRPQRPVRREAGADLYGHPRLAGEREAEGFPMPERDGGAVRTGAGTVVPEEGAGFRQGVAGAVGHVGLIWKPTVNWSFPLTGAAE